MRKDGFLILAILCLFVAVVLFLFSEQLLEREIESIAQAKLGTRVEIDNLRLYLLGKPGISFDALRIVNPVDPWQNLLETGYFGFQLEPQPLLSKKFIINAVQMKDVAVATGRDSDGRVDGDRPAAPDWLKAAKEKLNEQIRVPPLARALSGPRKVDADSLIDHTPLQTLEILREARATSETTRARWQSTISRLIANHKAKGLQDKNSGEDAGLTNEGLTEISEAVARQKGEVIEEFNAIENALRDVQLVEEDLQALRRQANLIEITPSYLAKLLFGERVVDTAMQVLQFVALTREIMPVGDRYITTGEEKEATMRGGQEIHFPITDQSPHFLIKYLFSQVDRTLAEITESPSVSASVKGITSDPLAFGKPLTFEIKFRHAKRKNYRLEGFITHDKNKPEAHLQFMSSGEDLAKIRLGQHAYLPDRLLVKQGDLDSGIFVNDDRLEFRLRIDAREVQFLEESPAQAADSTAAIIRSAFNKSKNLYFYFIVFGPFDDLSVDIQCDLTDKLSRQIQTHSEETIEKAAATLQSKMQRRVNEERRAVQQSVSEARRMILDELSNYEIGKNGPAGQHSHRRP